MTHMQSNGLEERQVSIMSKNKEWHFDIEIITDTHVFCITSFPISQHKVVRGINMQELKRVLESLENYEIKGTINIRGVNY